MLRPPASNKSHRGSRNAFNDRGAAKRATQRGLFSNGIWRCDCALRLPAERFKVKKEGKNQGRWFYTCQQAEPQRCGFFLWEEDAKPREEAAVLANSRSEPREHVEREAGRKGLFAGSRGESATVLVDDDSTESEGPSPSHRKRKFSPIGLDDHGDELYSWPATAQEARTSNTAANGKTFETPKKAQKTGVYATPATSTAKRKLPWVAEQAEPSGVFDSTDDFTTPSKPSAILHRTDPTTPSAPPTLATASSPTPPTRYRNALSNPEDSASSLTSSVLTVLANHKVALPSETLLALRSVLTRHDLRTQGIAKGREISRLALRKKDARIAELQERIVGLEAEREVDRGLVRALRKGPRG